MLSVLVYSIIPRNIFLIRSTWRSKCFLYWIYIFSARPWKFSTIISLNVCCMPIVHSLIYVTDYQFCLSCSKVLNIILIACVCVCMCCYLNIIPHPCLQSLILFLPSYLCHCLHLPFIFIHWTFYFQDLEAFSPSGCWISQPNCWIFHPSQIYFFI